MPLGYTCQLLRGRYCRVAATYAVRDLVQLSCIAINAPLAVSGVSVISHAGIESKLMTVGHAIFTNG